MRGSDMIRIDGSKGEGGGQILRTALSLSLLTKKPFIIEKIRAGRAKTGLLRQHLTSVRAAQTVGKAQVLGAEMGSARLEFIPEKVHSGEYEFSIGTAGSAILVAQTILPALLFAENPSRVSIEGGTHNPFSPTFDFFSRSYIPVLEGMGAKVTATLERTGFFPTGGGKIQIQINPVQKLSPLSLVDRGEILEKSARALVSHLKLEIAHRELRVIGKSLGLSFEQLKAVEVNALSPGNAVIIEIKTEQVTEIFATLGERGVRAERVAEMAVDQARQYLKSGAAVGEYLTDQLLLPMALAGQGSMTCSAYSDHAKSNQVVIETFLENTCFQVVKRGEIWRVSL
jgi:RNA 3'-terminal phosphate cyclase (ATP)